MPPEIYQASLGAFLGGFRWGLGFRYIGVWGLGFRCIGDLYIGVLYRIYRSTLSRLERGVFV